MRVKCGKVDLVLHDRVFKLAQIAQHPFCLGLHVDTPRWEKATKAEAVALGFGE